jgi:hypothetical protein
MDLKVGSISSEAMLPLLLANLAEAREAAQLLRYVGLNVVVEQDERRLLRLPFFAPRHRGEQSVGQITRRERVVSVAILVADSAITTVDHDIDTLVSGDSSGRLDRLGPGGDDPGVPPVSIALDGPPAVVRHDMLVPRHFHPL